MSQKPVVAATAASTLACIGGKASMQAPRPTAMIHADTPPEPLVEGLCFR